MSEGIEKDVSPMTAENKEQPSVMVSDKKNSQKPSAKKDKSLVERIKIWSKEVIAEYSKVIWPTRKELAKMTVTVVVTSLVFAILIAFLDAVLHYGITNLISWF